MVPQDRTLVLHSKPLEDVDDALEQREPAGQGRVLDVTAECVVDLVDEDGLDVAVVDEAVGDDERVAIGHRQFLHRVDVHQNLLSKLKRRFLMTFDRMMAQKSYRHS